MGGRLRKEVQKRTVARVEEHNSGTKVPTTRFDGRVSPFRVFTTSRFQLDELKGIRKAVEGSTINDVVTTIISGALRRYLDHNGELPRDTMVAMMPSLAPTTSPSWGPLSVPILRTRKNVSPM